MSPPQRWVAGVLDVVEQTEEAPSLAEMATPLGVAPGHLARRFHRAAGGTPYAFLVELEAERLRRHLRGGVPVTLALYDADFGSSRSLYERAAELFGMTPGA